MMAPHRFIFPTSPKEGQSEIPETGVGKVEKMRQVLPKEPPTSLAWDLRTPQGKANIELMVSKKHVRDVSSPILG